MLKLQVKKQIVSGYEDRRDLPSVCGGDILFLDWLENLLYPEVTLRRFYIIHGGRIPINEY